MADWKPPTYFVPERQKPHVSIHPAYKSVGENLPYKIATTTKMTDKIKCKIQNSKMAKTSSHTIE